VTAVRALVAREPALEALRLEEIELPEVGPGEIRVRTLAAGVCHSDLSMVNGTLSPPYPLVLGHEAAGVVTEAGAGVSRVEVGDRVVLNWSPPCRECWFCRRGEPWLCEPAGNRGPAVPRGTTAAGEPLHVTLGLGALAEEVVVGEDAAVPVPAELPAEQAALLGCAVLTGVGAVRNTARVAAGDAVLVIGLGGVGLSVLLGARQAGANPIVAVDVSDAKRELALSAGATDYLVAGDALAKQVRGDDRRAGGGPRVRVRGAVGDDRGGVAGGAARRSGHRRRHGCPRRPGTAERAGRVPLGAGAAVVGVRGVRPGPGRAAAGPGRAGRRARPGPAGHAPRRAGRRAGRVRPDGAGRGRPFRRSVRLIERLPFPWTEGVVAPCRQP
jgi:Zn-dependent alcohol dehydrogenase